MAKSKILVKAAAKPATGPDHPEPTARPRTAGGERGLLRRFRLGRILFGAGPDAGALVRRDGLQIFRTNSVHAPAPDLPHMPMSPSVESAQTLAHSPRRGAMRVPTENYTDKRKSHYSMLSRRSSAPDVAEITRRLSRHTEEDFTVPAEPSHAASSQHNLSANAALLSLQTFKASAGQSLISNRHHGSTSSSHHSSSADVESAPNMTRATLVWKDPQPPSLETQPASVTTTTSTSCSLSDSPALPSENVDEGKDYAAAYMMGPKTLVDNEQNSRHSLNLNATRSPPPQSRSPPPPASPKMVLPTTVNTSSPWPLPPLPTSPLPVSPTQLQEPFVNTTTISTTQLPQSAHVCAIPANNMGPIPLRRRNVSEQGGLQQYRPKSLYERPSCRALSALHREVGGSAAPQASSISSAKSFLMLIASSNGNGAAGSAAKSNSLTNVTHEPQSYPPHSHPSTSTSIPAIATGFETAQDLERQLHSTTGDTSAASRVYNIERCAQEDTESLACGVSPVSPDVSSSRSLRARSKLAGVGIRRASTYMWNRSSVFVRTLSSTDELPGSSYPLQQPGSSGGVWESDMDTGSTKTDDSASQNGAAALPTLALAYQINCAPKPPALPPVVPLRPSKKSPAAMRLHAARELVMTEKNFVDNLFIIKKVWMEPVFSSANSLKPIIPYQTARVIFYGVAALHAHASRFYREMDFALGSYERVQQPSEPVEDDGMRIGALFRANDRHWSDFIAYVRNYGAAVGCLKQLQDYKPYLRYHEECMFQKRTSRQSLKDLLMLPIQRITRYTLLLKNILKHTPAVHSDHIDLCRAVKNVTHFATIVNECRRKQEETYRTAEVLRSIGNCPPLYFSESRLFVAEYAVRELISRLPTRLMLFSDMLIVAQAPAHAMLDDTGSVGAEAVWTYYGSALLDEVEVQNADESTNTLITILSLNRNSVSVNNFDSSSRRSLPFGSEQSANISSTSEPQNPVQNGSQCGSTDTSDHADSHGRSSARNHGSGLQDASYAGAALKKKKSKNRRGILNTGSRDSIPDHIAALSHSTFPSPVPAPSHLERTQSRFYSTSPSPVTDVLVDRDVHPPPIQRPKTASGSHSTSSSTLVGHGGPLHSFDLAPPFRNQLQDAFSNTISGTPVGVAGRTDAAALRSTHLTLVMQHATSIMRKQFVRALKDTTATFIHDTLSLGDSDAASIATHLVGDSSSEVLNLHPL
ncbi:hypothetical protein COEREDRAFT_83911 [Coemansia reversa NRRL 1564]|uniref:DH domain-containing protein n=1 Tax=Coemansia reversa (strain ATCC 12441 / NRRL 1564) TaxID=763665 RepID=A0A2G5B248_COERN|nr:hypothetical protein COEREDRAFT_83911 [Coemansia reversa NRRL 1564]|eukprot:PIA12787.1 hypothetical protein COEREDRAFT_83911 [Coemansia reversa NRRL 1564]